MASCDAEYNFLYVDAGTAGRWSDGGTYDSCSLATVLENKTAGVPADSQLPGKKESIVLCLCYVNFS